MSENSEPKVSSTLPPPPPPPSPFTVVKRDTIVIPLATDERCWFKCRQTNAGRVRGQDPICSIFCYYSNKLPILSMSPSPNPKNHSNLHKSSSTSSTNPQKTTEGENNKNERFDELLKKYSISFLDGKYIYIATGKPALINHLNSMKVLNSIENDWEIDQSKLLEKERQEKVEKLDKNSSSRSNTKQNSNQTHRGLMALAYHQDYERLINLSHSFAYGIASIHSHFEKIYGPSYRILNKLPTSISQLLDSHNNENNKTGEVPSQFKLMNEFFNNSENKVLSNSLNLINRSFESLNEVLSRLSNRYLNDFKNDKKPNNNDKNDGSKKPPLS